MAKITVPSKPTELRGAPRAPADPDPRLELGYRFHRLATSLDGVAGALAMCLDELPADDTKASVRHAQRNPQHLGR